MDTPATASRLAKIEAAMQRLNVGRAVGAKGLQAELLQFGCVVIGPELEAPFHVLWDRGFLPENWGFSSLQPMLKKSADEISSCRPIYLVSLINTVLMQILLARLSPTVENTLGECQHGFFRTRSTTDAIFTLRQLCEKCRQKRNGKLLTCFINLAQAFNRVSLELL